MADLTTKFVGYLVTLKTAAPTAKDVTTLVDKNLATARAAASGELDDANTMYERYLS